MAKINTLLCAYDSEEEEEEYINMELNSLDSNLPFQFSTSSAKSREFEFQMSSSCSDKESAAAADELFYRGKLLPLHLPPRLKMVQNLLGGEATIPLVSTAPCTSNTTPLDSCNVSPSESCRASCELNPGGGNYFFEWSAELSTSIDNRTRKKTWAKKIKYSILGQIKLKASRDYLKSLLAKPDRSCAKLDICKKAQFAKASSCSTIADVVQSLDDKEDNRNNNAKRRSFSGVTTKRLSSSSSNSSTTSLNSSGFHNQLQVLMSSSGAAIECSIEAAIAHCKSSQQTED